LALTYECDSKTRPPHHNRFTALFRDHPGEPVPEENSWTLWCKGRFTEADTLTIRLGATPSGLTSAHLQDIAKQKMQCQCNISLSIATTIATNLLNINDDKQGADDLTTNTNCTHKNFGSLIAEFAS